MPRGYKGKSRVRGGSTKGQRKAKPPRGSSGSPGGEMTKRLTRPSGRH
jgi:hypothetical protein